jgi:hypothetical protein
MAANTLTIETIYVVEVFTIGANGVGFVLLYQVGPTHEARAEASLLDYAEREGGKAEGLT